MVFDFFFQIKCIDRNKYCHLTVAVRDKLVSWRRRIYFFIVFTLAQKKCNSTWLFMLLPLHFNARLKWKKNCISISEVNYFGKS